MVLVDTSVWIRFLMDKEPYADALEQLLADDEVAGHELVFDELLIGNKGGRKKLLDAYEKMRYASAIPHSELLEFVRTRKLHGRGAGWIDIHLLASAVVDGLRFWTADPRLAALAKELHVAYDPA